jgi:hypothetical protein
MHGAMLRLLQTVHDHGYTAGAPQGQGGAVCWSAHTLQPHVHGIQARALRCWPTAGREEEENEGAWEVHTALYEANTAGAGCNLGRGGELTGDELRSWLVHDDCGGTEWIDGCDDARL